MLFTTCTKLFTFPFIIWFSSVFITTFIYIYAFFNSCFIKIFTLFISSFIVNSSVSSLDNDATAWPFTVVIMSDIYSKCALILGIHSSISFAISWWSWEFTSGSSIDSSYSRIKFSNPCTAPAIDIIGVFRLCAIPPISWPSPAKRSLSINISWLFFIVSISSLCCVISFNKNNIPNELLSDFIGVISILKYFFISEKCCSKDIVSSVSFAFCIDFVILTIDFLLTFLLFKNLIKFLLLIFSGFKLNISKNVLLKSVIVFSSSSTTYPSDILSTIFCNAIGVIFKKLNFNIANV